MLTFLARFDQRGELRQRVECVRIQFGILDSHAEIIFDVESNIHQAKRIDQAAGDQRFIGGNRSVRLFQDLRGKV